SLEITCMVNASGDYTNTASVDGTEDDLNPSNNEDEESTIPIPVADIQIAKGVDNATPYVGDNVVFTLYVRNAGPSDATGVYATDILPSGYTYISDDGAGDYDNTSGIWTIGDMPFMESLQLNITCMVNASGDYTNTSSAFGNELDLDLTNNYSDTLTTPIPVADLEMIKVVDNPNPNVGENVIFTLSVTNNGPSDATGVVATDNIPSGYNYLSDNGSGAYNSSTGLWTIGALANGASVNLEITCSVNASGEYTNTASVEGIEEDLNPANDEDDDTTVPNPVADLEIIKTVDNATPNVGENVVFTLMVVNNGPSDATSVVATDNLPSGYAYLSDDGAGSYDNTNGIWTIGNLANGASVSLHITCKVHSSGEYTNEASVTAAEEDPDLSNNEDDISTDPNPIADLRLQKTVDNSNPNVGDLIVFTISVWNYGPSHATGVIATDQLPSGYTYVSDDAAGDYDPITGIWNIGNLNAGVTVELNITCMVNASGEYINTATVTANEDDPILENNDGEASTTPIALADLAITKTIDNPNPNVGEDVIFTLTVTNNGPSDATAVVATDNIPSGYTYVSDDASGAYDPVSGIWTIGNLANGASEQLNITVSVNASGEYLNTASVSGAEEDPDLNNNEDEASVSPTPIADLSILKSVNNETPNVGDQVVFTLVVHNDGPSDASGVIVTEHLPSGYTYVSDDASGAYDPVSGIWTIGNLANGASEQLNITVSVNASGDYVNTATVTANEEDPNLDNNEEEASVSPTPIADLNILKTVNNETPNVGDQIIFTLVVNNNGPSDASGVVVTEHLPSGYTYVSDDANGDFDPSSGLWTIGDLVNGASEVLNITVIVNASGDYTNTASVTANEIDPNEDDNNSTITPDPIFDLIADLSIIKTVDNETPHVGDEIVFTLSLTNNGPDAATGVIVTDHLASGYTYVSDDSNGNYDPSSGLWTVGTMANGETQVLNIRVIVNASGDYTNTASVTANEIDPNEDDNTSTVIPDPVSDTTIDLAIEKTVDEPSPREGSAIIFTLKVTNFGPLDASGVTVIDLLPTGYEYISDNSNGNYDALSGIWSIGDLANGADISIDMVVRVLSSGEYENIASVSANEIDSDLSNNEDAITPDVREIEFEIPDGFSPNEDGINDFFVIPGVERYPNLIITIFNRWGNKVFEAKGGYDNSWDGRNQFGITVGGNY
ncbi:MAG: hypothetical protein B6242_16510, partial [Anaerolineaceae bacterium 4572_78]